jgi:transcription elongation GreA/GreB family factor
MVQETVYLSKKGMKDLRKTIAQLERSLDNATREVREADKSDSREERYILIEKMARVEHITAELADKKSQLQHATLLPRRRDALRVALGSVVDLLDTNGRIVRYTLVNSIEADPSDGRISVNSPLGRSLIGRTIRDTVEWSVGLRANQLQLVRIS